MQVVRRPIIITRTKTGVTRVSAYGCGYQLKCGDAVCTVKMREPRDVVEETVFRHLLDNVLTADAMAAISTRVVELARDDAERAADGPVSVEAREADLQPYGRSSSAQSCWRSWTTRRSSKRSTGPGPASAAAKAARSSSPRTPSPARSWTPSRRPGITISDRRRRQEVLSSDFKIPEAGPRGAQSIVDAIRSGDLARALELAEALARLATAKTAG